MFALLVSSFLSGCIFSYYVYTKRQIFIDLDEELQSMALSYIFKINNQIVLAKQKVTQICDNYVVINFIVNMIIKYNNYLKTIDELDRWVEPVEKSWISRYSIYKNGDRFEVQDVYYKSAESQEQDAMNLLFYEPYFNVIDDMNRHNLKDALIIMKNNDKYIIRVYENPETFLQELPEDSVDSAKESETKNDFVDVDDTGSKDSATKESDEQQESESGEEKEKEEEEDVDEDEGTLSDDDASSEPAEYKLNKRKLMEESTNFLLLNDKQSRIQFISVEYQGGNKVVDIKIPDSHYICGNQILSPAYIARYLAFNDNAKNYCDDYVLKIIDNNVSIVELRNYQYVEIQEKSYLIKELVM